jgi:hypothetical protein
VAFNVAILDDLSGTVETRLAHSREGLKQGAVLIHDIHRSSEGSKDFEVV